MADSVVTTGDLSFDFSDSDKLIAAMKSAFNSVGLTKWAAVDVVPWLRERAKARFDDEGDDATGRWAPLREATLAVRLSEGAPSGPINDRFGDLRAWITSSYGMIAPDGLGVTVEWPGPGSSTEESKLRVAQRGSPRGANPEFPSSTTVPRPVVAISEIDAAGLLASLSHHLTEFVAGGTVGLSIEAEA